MTEKELLKKIYSIFYKNHCRYGYIRVNMELNKEIHINQKKTQRIMHENGLKAFQGNDISTKANFEQTKRMLNKAFRKYVNLDGLIFQSDQGWQYQSIYYQNELKKQNIRQSFSRKVNCIDNSIMENFFGIMKKEMFYGYEKDFKTLEELRIAMNKYIKYYNNKRINKKRKGLSPLEYRQQYFSLINKN